METIYIILWSAVSEPHTQKGDAFRKYSDAEKQIEEYKKNWIYKDDDFIIIPLNLK